MTTLGLVGYLLLKLAIAFTLFTGLVSFGLFLGNLRFIEGDKLA